MKTVEYLLLGSIIYGARAMNVDTADKWSWICLGCGAFLVLIDTVRGMGK